MTGAPEPGSEVDPAGRPARSATIAKALAELDRVRDLAAGAERPDLLARLDAARGRLVADDVPVAVVGEYKQGKSTLVNALLRTDVCPVDTDVVTAVPTIVRYGVPPSVVAHLEPSDGATAELRVPFDQLRSYVVERRAGAPALRTVEVRLDRQLLRSGLSFIDTPGVGGLDSAHGNLTLGALPLARAALFVTDAAQELTAPELEFLTRTVERCPRVACVVTKIDLHGEWRRIVDLNHGHLSRAGLSVPLVPVSSFLRLRAGARDSTALNAESGFPRLLALLRRDILGGADIATAQAARQDVALAVAQLREQVGAERTAVAHPEQGEAIAGWLSEKARRRRELTGGSASWQVALTDGIQDLTTDIEHDLRERLRAMLRRGEALIDAGDPKDTWPDFEAWAAREASAAAVDNLFTLVSRTEYLARDVAERFDLEFEGLDLDLPSPVESLAQVASLNVRFERSSMRQMLGAFTAARVTYFGGLVAFGILGATPGLFVVAPAGLAVGVAVGRKLAKDEKQRQVQYRREQAKHELRRYVDEVAFVVGKDSRDAVRRSQRYLRDEFGARAALAQRSSARALDAVRQATELAGDDRSRRAGELEQQWRDLDRLAERLGTPATPTRMGATPTRMGGATPTRAGTARGTDHE